MITDHRLPALRRSLITIFMPAYIVGLLLISPPPILASGKAGLFDMPLADLMDVQVTVEVASLFEEDERVVGSSVSRVTPEQWNRLGARRTRTYLKGRPVW